MKSQAERAVLVLTDNVVMARETQRVIDDQELSERTDFVFGCSPASAKVSDFRNYVVVDVHAQASELTRRYDLVLSMHCKQIFPPRLVSSTRCVNVHPGLNPHNRGWYPQVFSILNGRPLGATIHEIDEELDHGPIIAQKQVPLFPWDTSLTAYERIQAAEVDLLRKNLGLVVEGRYETCLPVDEGNVNLKSDFEALRELDMDARVTYAEALNRLRALTHGGFRNAYFRDATGRKVFVRIELEPDMEN